MPEIPAPQGPSAWERIIAVRDFLGLQHRHPKGAMDNLKYSMGVFPAIRNGIGRILSYADRKSKY